MSEALPTDDCCKCQAPEPALINDGLDSLCEKCGRLIGPLSADAEAIRSALPADHARLGCREAGAKMSDTYHAIYDAVRSRVHGCDVGSAVGDAVSSAFGGASYLWQHAQQEIYAVSNEMQRPSVLYRPSIAMDGSKWCALYGADLMHGIAGWGDTAAEAMADFDKNWREERTPGAQRMAKS